VFFVFPATKDFADDVIEFRLFNLIFLGHLSNLFETSKFEEKYFKISASTKKIRI